MTMDLGVLQSVLLTVLVVATGGLQAASNGGIQVDPPTVPLGQLHSWQHVPFSFTLYNRGDSALSLWPPRQGCDCQAGSFVMPKAIKPGEQATISGVLELKQLKDGPYTKRLIMYAGPASAKAPVSVQLTGTIANAITVTPAPIRMPMVKQGVWRTAPVKVTVTTATADQCTWTIADSASDFIAIKEDALAYRALPPFGSWATTLNLTTQTGDTYHIPVSGYHAPPVRCNPAVVTLNQVGNQHRGTARLQAAPGWVLDKVDAPPGLVATAQVQAARVAITIVADSDYREPQGGTLVQGQWSHASQGSYSVNIPVKMFRGPGIED